MALLIIAFFSLCALIEIPRLARAKRTKELVWFCVFSAIGLTLFMLLLASVKIPGPIKVIMGWLDWIGLHYPA
ncbi:MAG: hypothetical protein BWY35_01540 [Firmicutes bacterium ADurb.Bin248]|nr:MAG: hypothetical protein BWY35_01540 [Firmicutes bacterium ADurb.Bin248]HOG00455.1 hypothetical protein [Clostridia bacterium]HPK16065.1 hypothetical protein [Clostridia bacterium]